MAQQKRFRRSASRSALRPSPSHQCISRLSFSTHEDPHLSKASGASTPRAGHCGRAAGGISCFLRSAPHGQTASAHVWRNGRHVAWLHGLFPAGADAWLQLGSVAGAPTGEPSSERYRASGTRRGGHLPVAGRRSRHGGRHRARRLAAGVRHLAGHGSSLQHPSAFARLVAPARTGSALLHLCHFERGQSCRAFGVPVLGRTHSAPVRTDVLLALPADHRSRIVGGRRLRPQTNRGQRRCRT